MLGLWPDARVIRRNESGKILVTYVPDTTIPRTCPADFNSSKAVTIVPRGNRYCRARSRVAGSLAPDPRRPSRISARKDAYNQRKTGIRERRGGNTNPKAVARLAIKVVHRYYYKWFFTTGPL